MRVKLANGVTLPVEFIGTIVLRIPAGDVRNGNGHYSAKQTLLELRDALYTCAWPLRYTSLDEGN
eukprot:6136260-Pleurochrysis_carterae.AAC.1